jgi:hypothetical protein
MMIKGTILALAVSLAIPAYAEPTPEVCDQLSQASDKLGDLIHDAKNKTLPLSEADKETMRQAADDFNKAIKNFFEIADKPVKKKHRSAAKAIAHGIGTWLTRPSYPLYGGAYPTAYNSPLIQPMQNMAPQNIITPSGVYPVLPMAGGGAFMPMGFPH